MKKRLFFKIGIFVLVLGLIIGGIVVNSKENIIDNNYNETSSTLLPAGKEIAVYVSGEIVNAGVYSVTDNTIIASVIALAGGITRNGTIDNLNVASKVSDGMKIVVSSKEGNNNKININKATKEELMTLKGIGETIALNIINYRKVNGDFNTIDDLKNVERIGESLFEGIKALLTV